MSVVSACSDAIDWNAWADGLGMLSARVTSIGSNSSTSSGSGGVARGESRGKVRAWSCLVW